MENLEKDLNLILDHSTKEKSRKIKELQVLELSEYAVKHSIILLNVLGDLSEDVTFEDGFVIAKGLNCKYSIPFDMLPEVVARFKQNKTKYRTKAAVLYNARTRC